MTGRRIATARAAYSMAALLPLLALDSCARSTSSSRALMPTSPPAGAAVASDTLEREPAGAGKNASQPPAQGLALVTFGGDGGSSNLTPPHRPPPPTPPLPGPYPPIPHCPILPADNIWNRDISRMAVHAKSATWVTSIGASKKLYVGFAPALFGMQYVLTGSATPKVSITFGQDPTHSDPGPYPFTATTPLEMGTVDFHAIMIDTTTCTLYELYNANWNGGQPRADAGVVFPLTSDALRPDSWSSADEAGLPIFCGLARWDEVLAGSIHHALRFEAAAGHIDGTLGAHLWPARHDPHGSSASNPALPPMGARFRLKSTYSITGFSPHAQVILRALQHYGMFLADIGYDWELIGTADTRWEKSVIDELESVPASQFEVVDETSLKITTNSAQSLTPP
ncbi:MAG: hypothetical protein ACRENS_03140 [Candidatus Eiseniibacteriota bacterium]